MIELLNCSHGGGPFHLLFDIWWMFLLAVPGAPYLVKKFGYRIKSWCCGHKEISKGKKNTHTHCHHDNKYTPAQRRLVQTWSAVQSGDLPKCSFCHKSDAYGIIGDKYICYDCFEIKGGTITNCWTGDIEVRNI